jgi:type I restriction enzyme R subunit
MVSAKGAKLLKDFILDPEQREKILAAYLNDDVTIQDVVIEQPSVEEGFAVLENPASAGEQDPESGMTIQFMPHINKSKAEIEKIINFTLAGVKKSMRSTKEIVEALFYVMDKDSIESLDGVGLFLHRAFINLYKDGSTIVDKFVSFNLLVTKFEAYLKKLYYLMKNEEVKPQNEGESVTWANVIHDVKPLWQLKYSTDEAKQQLYQWLLMVKEWRNSESHISPTASEQELNAAISIIVTMYCYATGSCITDLEMNGHYIEEDTNTSYSMAAEPPVDYN